jgi:hypothetical protein
MPKSRPVFAAATDAPSSAPHAAGSSRARATARSATWAFAWTLAFAAVHGYWYLGGRVGFGDLADPLPGAPSSLGDWIFSGAVVAMFAAGLVVPRALVRPWGRRLPRRLLVWSTVAIDTIFLSGGLLFGHAARLARPTARSGRTRARR